MKRSLRLTCLAAALLPGLVGCGGAEETISIEPALRSVSMDAPVGVGVGELSNRSRQFVATASSGGGREVVFQRAPAVLESGAEAYCAVLPDGLAPGSYTTTSGRSEPAAFSFADEGGRLVLYEGEDPVLGYNYGTQLPAGVPEEYRRSSYVHPIWDTKGTVVTDDFPEDHYHHRGLSWMWPRVFVEGEEYDLWALRGLRPEFDEWLVQETGPVCATIGVKNAWHMQDRNVVEEEVLLRAYRAGSYGRAIDVRLTFHALEPIRISGRETDDKGYGGLSLRFGPREETIITTAEGVQASDSDHHHTPWADESGKFRGADTFSGIAVFQHASNPDFPTAWTLRHYGFIGPAWPGLDIIPLEPGKPLTLRFRIWVHEGDAVAGRVEDAYRVFSQAPVIRVQR